MVIRALVVDDNEINGMMVQNVLEGYNVKSEFASNGRRAIELASAEQYDIVFMDYIMPDMDGVVTTRYMRNIAGYENLPVVALTAEISEEVTAEFADVGVKIILTKPISQEKVGALLYTLFKIRRKAKNEPGTSDYSGLREYLKGIKGLDFETGMKNSLDSEKNYHLVMKMTIKNIGECEQSIARYISGADRDVLKLRIALHSLKGVFINIGMSEMSFVAGALEKYIRDFLAPGDMDSGGFDASEMIERLEHFDRELCDITQEISHAIAAYDNMKRNMRSKTTGDDVQKIDESRSEIINDVLYALARYDIDRLMDNLEKLIIIAEGAEREMYEQMLDAAGEFNYDYVSELLARVTEKEKNQNA